MKGFFQKILRYTRKNFKKVLGVSLVLAFVIIGAFLIWITTFALPDLNNFEERRVAQSTKIYDRTGEIILYDVFGEYKRTVIPISEMNENLKEATIAIEDQNFYQHNGIQISSIFRAIISNIMEGNLLGGQGGSTITQQVIKNALLGREKTVTRKIKEWVLAPRLEEVLTKDQILEIYLNEIPYGGSVYGIEEASRRFFAKSAKDLSIAESAYLAALPQAPSYYSPYGKNIDRLESRKNKVLEQMKSLGFITEQEYEQAKNEKVDFQKQEDYGIKAPHFVLYVIEQLEKEYGEEMVQEGGLKVITTLDWKLQEKAEEIVKRRALENQSTYNAENGAIVATDPKNGDILVMVGSRDYFDKEIDGNFNIALAERQPGSAFKPFVYAEAFNKGYRPETVVFDLPTEFSTTCSSGGDCYSPQNYDNIFRGPMTLRDALAQSVNIPAVKVLYLAGLRDSLNLAKRLGIETLTNVGQYGLTLVLGGGEVRPLDMSLAYSIFANDGVKFEERNILKIEDASGKVLFESKDEERQGNRVLSEQTSRLISDVLSDNSARAPAFGSNSYLFFPNQDVAVKTGTTNDYRDAWIVGYTPNISVAAWAGNNDNAPMEKKVAGFIVAPMWNEFMQVALAERPVEYFNNPSPIDPEIKPIIAGNWNENGVHSILHWVNTSDPLGPAPSNPNSDPQYSLWESAVQAWAGNQDFETSSGSGSANGNDLNIIGINDGESYYENVPLSITAQLTNGSLIKSGEVYINSKKVGNLSSINYDFTFTPLNISGIKNNNNRLRVEVEDQNGKNYEETISFDLN